MIGDKLTSAIKEFEEGKPVIEILFSGNPGILPGPYGRMLQVPRTPTVSRVTPPRRVRPTSSQIASELSRPMPIMRAGFQYTPSEQRRVIAIRESGKPWYLKQDEKILYIMKFNEPIKILR